MEGDGRVIYELFLYFRGGTQKASVTTYDVLAEIRTDHFSNVSLDIQICSCSITTAYIMPACVLRSYPSCPSFVHIVLPGTAQSV